MTATAAGTHTTPGSDASPYRAWEGTWCGPHTAPRRFWLIELLSAEGSEGVTFTAIDSHAPISRRKIVLKIARPELGADELERVRRRWAHAAAARTRHPGLVGIDEPFIGVAPGARHRGPTLLYLPMHHVEGTPLDRHAELLGGWGPALLDALRLPASALDYLSAERLTHLDVKPGNVIVAPEGNGVIVDLGSVRGIEATPTIFTLGFVAPEVLAAHEHGDANLSRADAYSFAATVSWALTGASPLRLPDDTAWTERLERLLPSAKPLRVLLGAALSRRPASRPTRLAPWLEEVIATSRMCLTSAVCDGRTLPGESARGPGTPLGATLPAWIERQELSASGERYPQRLCAP